MTRCLTSFPSAALVVSDGERRDVGRDAHAAIAEAKAAGIHVFGGGLDEAVQLAEQAFLDELAKLVEHLGERLNGETDGKPKVFRDTAVTNLTEFFERFRALSVHSNDQLDDLVQRAQRLMNGVEPTEDLRKELVKWVRTEIGPIASPDLIQWAPGLPKTRSGKIMRRILRKIAENDYGALGDTSTLADPSVVDDLIANRMNRA